MRRRTLLQRADAMEQLINDHLWDSSRGIFANRVKHNDSLSERVGPTSFYPMQGGTASVAQVCLPAPTAYNVLREFVYQHLRAVL